MTFEKLEQLRKEDFKRRERDGFMFLDLTIFCQPYRAGSVSAVLFRIFTFSLKQNNNKPASFRALNYFITLISFIQLWLLLGLKSIVKYF